MNSESDFSHNKYIYLALGAFVVTCAVLFAAGTSLSPKGVGGYNITKQAKAQTDGTFVITVDTSDRVQWIPINLGAGRVATASEKADVYLRRYIAQAPGGACDLGDVGLAEAKVESGVPWVADTIVDGQVQNETLSTWYNYSYWTHLLEAKPKTYAVKLVAGGIAYLRFVSYYCRPEGSGCLTLRYRLERG